MSTINGVDITTVNGVKVVSSLEFARIFKIDHFSLYCTISKMINSNGNFKKYFTTGKLHLSTVKNSTYDIAYEGFRVLVAIYTNSKSKSESAARLKAKEQILGAFKETEDPNFTLVDKDEPTTDKQQGPTVYQREYQEMSVTEELQLKNSNTRIAKTQLVYININKFTHSEKVRRELMREVGRKLFKTPIVFIDEEERTSVKEDLGVSFDVVDDIIEAVSNI